MSEHAPVTPCTVTRTTFAPRIGPPEPEDRLARLGRPALARGKAEASYISILIPVAAVCRMSRPLIVLLIATFPALGLAQSFERGANAFATGDYVTAQNEWASLAEEGNVEAQASLGEMYLSGIGVPQDSAKAIKLLRSAAIQGHPVAQFNLGVMYGAGDGVAQDLDEAEKWYRLSALQGNSNAQNNLGVLYSKGSGVPQNLGLAADWFRKAAKQGEANAQNTLGKMFTEGLGMPKDRISAHMWFAIATVNGSRESAANLAKVARAMSREEISEAMKRATECLSSGHQNC